MLTGAHIKQYRGIDKDASEHEKEKAFTTSCRYWSQKSLRKGFKEEQLTRP